MADYPSITQRIGTLREAASGIRMSRAVSGRPTFRRYSVQDWFIFKVQHECSEADKDSILSHYATHRMLEFDFTFDATDETYPVQYSDAPKIQPLAGEERWLVESYLIGTARLPYGVVAITSNTTLSADGESSSRRRSVSLTGVATLTLAKRKAVSGTVSVSVTSVVSSTGVSS